MVRAVAGAAERRPGLHRQCAHAHDGRRKGHGLSEEVAKQNITNMTTSQRTVLDCVRLGDFLLGLMIFNRHTVIRQQGAPTKILKVEPSSARQASSALLNGGPNPATPACS